MNTSHSIARHRRYHTLEFKQSLVALCHPGISISGVALAQGVNANLLRRWIKQFSGVQLPQAINAPAKLVPVKVNLPSDATISDAIEISIQKNSACVSIRWPASQATAFGQLLKDLLE
ncbi:MAG: transposase [Gallionella sp.]|jgi:transposase-like protein